MSDRDQAEEPLPSVMAGDVVAGALAPEALFDNAAANPATQAPNPAAFFADGKAPDAFRTIGEVSLALHIRPHVLRYWEEQFPMLRPVKRSGGRRYYRPEDVALVQAIDRLVHREGYTLRGARQFLEGRRPPVNEAPQAARMNGKATKTRASTAPVAPGSPPEDLGALLAGALDGAQGASSAALAERLRAIRDRLASALAEA